MNDARLAAEALQAQRDDTGGSFLSMTLRDYFAAKAMQAMLTSPGNLQEFLISSKMALAYKIADDMLKAKTAAYDI